MRHKVRIEIELFSPVEYVLYDKYKDRIKELFFEMLEDIENSSINIKLDNTDYQICTEMKQTKSEVFRAYGLLNLSYEVDLDNIWNYEKVMDNNGKEVTLTSEELYAYKRTDLRIETEKFVMDFTFAVNLAYLGLFEFDSARIFVNDVEEEWSRIDRTLVEWTDSYLDCLEEKWPEVHILKIEQVWKWLNEKTNYISSGMSTNAIERALNALSYTMNDGGSHYEEMFYILIGLEAIYNDNKNIGITEQIRTKTELLLKRPAEYKKKITKFYDNRSEFLHGKMNFPNSYYRYDATKEFEEFFFQKYINTVQNAKAILISTIQEYIIQNASEMKVKTSVVLK